MATDEELTDRVWQAILKDDRLSAQPISVSVTDGVVVLTGTVQSHRHKLAAQEIAASFEGCRGVVNELAVEPPGQLPDEEVLRYVRSALEAHADVTERTITTLVLNGIVTLGGSVASHWERAIAEDVVIGTKGARGAHNLLRVDLSDRIEDEALCREIQAALSYTRGLGDANLQVAVDDGKAVLSGEVAGLWQREIAEAVTRRFRVMQVRNEIAVTGA